MGNNTGFYRVSQVTYSYKTKKGIRKKNQWRYQVKNALLDVSITSNDLLKLKIKVLEANLDWGIIDIEKAIETAKIGKYNIKDLEGQYGIKVKGE